MENTIGFMCNINKSQKPIHSLGPNQITRAVHISRVLKDFGSKLLIYSPIYIDLELKTVPGFYVEGNDFIFIDELPIPIINCNWTVGTKTLHREEGIGYEKFKVWSRDNGIQIYVPYTFVEIALDKYCTHSLISGFDQELCPYTELFERTKFQLQDFFTMGDIIFLKPRKGGRGNRIISLKKQNRNSYSLSFYTKKQKQEYNFNSLEDVLKEIEKIITNRNYIVQKGIETQRYNGHSFDVRVLMLHDGKDWHCIHQARIGAKDYDISNVSQGGIEMVLEELLLRVYGKKHKKIINEVGKLSFSLADYLESKYPSQLIELAFDFVLDKTGNIYLVEINTKPGLYLQILTDVFNIQPEEREVFTEFIEPHIYYMGKFLQTKLEEIN